MDWDDLRFVLAIARHGSLSGAGVHLGVNHTTVGRRLGRLEKTLGVRLFDRTPDGFHPTSAGLDLEELATEIEARVLRGEAEVKGHDSKLEGALQVSTLDFLFEAFADVFASFCERHPGVDLTVRSTVDEVSLYRREADVVFRMTNAPPETLVGRQVGKVWFAVYGHRRLAERTTDWNALPWLHWDEQLESSARWLDDWLAKNAPDARITLRLGESTLVRRAALRAGIGVHPLACLEGDPDPDLVRIGPTLVDFTRGLWLLTLPTLRHTRRVRAFLDHVTEALTDHPALRGP